ETERCTISACFADPGPLDTHRLSINCGDGSAPQTVNLAALSLHDALPIYQYLDDNPTGTASDLNTISVTVTDDDTGSGNGGTSGTVNHVAPSAATVTPRSSSINENDSITISGGFADPGTLDTHTLAINWGD